MPLGYSVLCHWKVCDKGKVHMSTEKNLHFGIKPAPQNTTYEDILRVWLEADSIPIIENAWVFDHSIPLGPDPTGQCLEAWTLLAALAARARPFRGGAMGAGTAYRHPAGLG